jgi:uncharacterized protein
VSSRFSAQLGRLSPPSGRSPLDEALPPDLEGLRAKMSALLGRELKVAPPHVEPPVPGMGLTGSELPFVRHETELGEIWLRRISRGRAGHVGPVPLGSAGEADMRLLGLISLCPELGRLSAHKLLYLDTETTGLGGSGTLAFLIGLAYFDDNQELTVEQLFLESPTEELALLGYLEQRVQSAEGLVTFNGKSFDWPLLETRRTMNRLRPLGARPHLDLLHLGRRLHKKRLSGHRLVDIERGVLGFERGDDDISGAEIAPRYHHFLRTQDPSGLVAVMEHNAWDVESMVALVGLYGAPVGLLHPEDLAQMGAALGRAKDTEWGLELAEKALAQGAGCEAERTRGLLHKARGDRAQALLSFEQLAEKVDDDAVRLELVKLYEHFTKDFGRALGLLAEGTGEDDAAAQRRKQRLEKKQQRSPKPAISIRKRSRVRRP